MRLQPAQGEAVSVGDGVFTVSHMGIIAGYIEMSGTENLLSQLDGYTFLQISPAS